MSRILIALFMVLSVGCMSTDPYTGQQKASNTAKGAGVGAIAGAVVGAATASKKDRGKGALTGAVAGGAIGGGVGFYMDKQEAKLRSQLQGTGVQVSREGDTIRLIMPGNITFDSNQANIRSSFYPTLNSVAVVLKEFNKTAIRVTGHTDSTGGSELNQRLSEQRADSVRQYLISQSVASGRVQTAGYGPRYPIASNDTASGREANRRVELELLPLE